MQELSRLKIEPWRTVGTQNGGVEAQTGGLEGLRPLIADRITLMRSTIRIRIHIEVKSWIRIRIIAKILIRIRNRIRGMQIRNPA
jgi:hypothetical protein